MALTTKTGSNCYNDHHCDSMPAWSWRATPPKCIEAYIDLRICSNNPKGGKDCCNIPKLRKGEYTSELCPKQYLGFDKGELTKFNGRELKSCDHFSLQSIHQFLVTYKSEWYNWHTKKVHGYWGGEFIKIHLDNQTTITCDIYEKVGDDGKFQQDIAEGCRESTTYYHDFRDWSRSDDVSSASVHEINRFKTACFLSFIAFCLLF